MKEKYLPLGTIVLLEGSKKELMIIGYCEVDVRNKKVFDYSGVVYPEGHIGSTFNILFNHSQIEKIVKDGFVNEKGNEYLKFLKNKTEGKTNEDIFNEFVAGIQKSLDEAEKKENNNDSEESDESNDASFGEDF